MNKIINLEEILNDHLSKDGFRLDLISKLTTLDAMKEACRAALELAAENGKVKIVRIEQDHAIWGVDTLSITDTIKQVK
jgi:hypothetical protein